MPWPPPSTVPNLLLSNLPPSEVEVDLVLNIVSEAESNMGRIRKQLEIQPKNRVLKNQLRTFENYITRHQSILSPLRRLPPELLYHIFTFFAPPRSYLNAPDNHSRWSELPWNLSQACHRWRAISLSMPLLWTKIPLLIPDRLYTADPSFLEFYTSFLLRSADQPICVFVSSYAAKPDKAVKRYPAIKILISHSYRWQHLSIVSHSSHLLRAFRPIKKRLPILRTLNLELDPEASLDIFKKAPKLSQVRFVGISPERITLPWKQLVHYKGRHDEMGATIPLHYSGRSLRTLELQIYPCDDFLEYNQSLSIVLPNLVELKLCGIIFGELTTFLLERLIVPAIEEISILGVDVFDPPIPITPLLTSMIRRSTNACVLERLSLGRSNYRQGELIALLRLTPRLVFLDIEFAIDDLVHLGVIDSAEGSSPLVPLLHTLAIASNKSDTYYTEAIITNHIAKKRCEEATPPIRFDTDAPEPSHPLLHTVPLRIFLMEFPTNLSSFEAQDIFNGWAYNPFEQCPPYSESRLFCDWASELQILFPSLKPSRFVGSKSFKRSMESLTSVQKIMAFTKAMVNYKLQEVKHLFVSLIQSFLPFVRDYSFRANKYNSFRQKFRVLVYLDRVSRIHMTNIPSHVAEGIRIQASSVLQKWRRRVILGFNDHHPWVEVAGVSKFLRYIPKYECRYPLFYSKKYTSERMVWLWLL